MNDWTAFSNLTNDMREYNFNSSIGFIDDELYCCFIRAAVVAAVISAATTSACQIFLCLCTK
jgi:hypothetical protein